MRIITEEGIEKEREGEGEREIQGEGGDGERERKEIIKACICIHRQWKC